MGDFRKFQADRLRQRNEALLQFAFLRWGRHSSVRR